MAQGWTGVQPSKPGELTMKSLIKLMIASLSLTTVLAAAATASVTLPMPGLDDRVERVCYGASGLIVPCKRIRPLF
jgi:hypothetical protein